MILCNNCNETFGYVIKDGGTILCLNCLHFIKVKQTCKGTCTNKCLKCTKTEVELRELSNILLKSI
jgi:hypothetical protein